MKITKKLTPPYLSTSFSQSGKSLKNRFENILNTKKRKNGTAAFSMFVSLVLVSGTLAACTGSVGIIGGADGPTSIYVSDDSAKKLYDSRIKYVGDASGVGKLISLLPMPEGYSAADDGLMKLQTTTEPYELTINLKKTTDAADDFSQFEKNAAVLMCLIDNLGSVTYKIGDNSKSYTRSDADMLFPQPLSEYAKSYDSFAELYKIVSAVPVNTVESAVSAAILSFNAESYLEGETRGEGHIILGSDTDKDENIIVYALTTYGEYGFENGIFTKVSGCGVIPAKITFDSGFNLKNFEMPEDGSYYESSLKALFPKKYHSRIMGTGIYEKDYDECSAQERQYAQKYLDSIGRKAEIQDHVNTEIAANIETNVSNTLLDLFMNEYPYWIGTRESVEGGTRYVYEHTWQPKEKDSQDGIVGFRKYEYDTGKTVEEYEIQVTGSEMKYLKGSAPTPAKYR